MPEALKPEQLARENIDRMLADGGWVVQHMGDLNPTAARGVAVEEFPLRTGYGFADYLLYVDGMPVGVVEAKPVGHTLTGVEVQNEKYSVGLPPELRPPRSPLPFLYQSTGEETRFTSLLDPDARSRQVFHFHRPDTLATWLDRELKAPGSTLRARLRSMPELIEDRLWPAQIRAIRDLERSLAQDRPRALIQMATGSGKTFTACNFVYRLAKFAGARRILFLVDRNNLGRQTLKEFQAFATPDDGRKFSELYNVQHMRSNKLDPVAKVCITTIQRLFSMLKGEAEYDEANEEESAFLKGGDGEPIPVGYNPAIPIETFDVIVTDECHRSIYGQWRQVLEYFDAYLVGLTATPSKQTFGFFNQNVVSEYGHADAVADGVNVDFDVYRISTAISEQGSMVEAGFYVDKRDRQTRATRWEQLDEPLVYGSSQLDRDIVAPDQIRTIIATFRDKLPEIFPGRREVPKTLIFAKDDSHADDIVQIVREEFAKGNDFCEKITYRTGTVRVTREDGTVFYKNAGSAKAEELLSSFRNAYNPRIVVTVDMIATGTDVKPLEIVFFLRSVRSRNLFEQMKGRGVRVANATEMQTATPDAKEPKQRFVLVDAVGICESGLSDTYQLDRKPTIGLEKLMTSVAMGNREPETLTTIASRLARLDRRLSPEQRNQLAQSAGGETLAAIAARIVHATDPDAHIEAAREAAGGAEPEPEQIAEAKRKLIEDAARPIVQNPPFRQLVVDVKRTVEQTIDHISKDELTFAGYSEQARDKAKALVQSFEDFLKEHRDEIGALQILYSRPYKQRLTYEQIKELAEAIGQPPRGWKPEALWRAYETLDRSKVRGSGERRLADIVSLVRFALHQDDELRPFRAEVDRRFDEWLAAQESEGRTFTPEQRQWLEMMRDHIADSVAIDRDDFEETPFVQKGGLGKAFQLFGPELAKIMDELNGELAA